MFFPNLEAELARRKINRSKLAKDTNIRPTTLSFKLNGKSPVTLVECILIRDAIDQTLSIDYLFKICEEDISEERV